MFNTPSIPAFWTGKQRNCPTKMTREYKKALTPTLTRIMSALNVADNHRKLRSTKIPATDNIADRVWVVLPLLSPAACYRAGSKNNTVLL